MITTGLGIDVHRFAEKRPLIIGGVRIPHDFGLEGHSDADVLAHAITDAVLGGAGLGDIGQHFPDTDPQFKGADSLKLLATALSLVVDGGYLVRHIDATVMTEMPKIAPYRDEIRESLASTLQLPVARVNIKATRGEGMGFIGRGEGVAALAIATLEGRE